MSAPKITYRAVYDDSPRTFAEVDADRRLMAATARELWKDGDESLYIRFRMLPPLRSRFYWVKQVGPPRFRWPRISVRPWSIYVAWRMTARQYGLKRPKAAR